MSDEHAKRLQQFEGRLRQLREEAQRAGTACGTGVNGGGPLPPRTSARVHASGYYGLPIIKSPVWEWIIPVYFFIGGLAGMSALVASGAWVTRHFDLARATMWSAAIGGVISPILLAWDLGRPLRFIYMLRVFKYQSPMSVGSWIVSAFGAFAIPGLVLLEWHLHSVRTGSAPQWLPILTTAAVFGAGFFGIFLATYTGALIAVTAVPAWNVYRTLLPFHFGVTGLGSAVAVPLLAGFHARQLALLLTIAAAAETLTMFWMELRRHGEVDHALHHGKSGWLLRSAELLEGPAALIFILLGLPVFGAGGFLLGSLLSRFGWISAGRASAANPKSVLASQTGQHPTAESSTAFNLKPAVASRIAKS